MPASTEVIDTLREEYRGSAAKDIKDFFAFLRIASIGAESEMDAKVRECASWVKGYLESIPMDVEVWETPQHPALFASDLSAGPDKPTVLIYNHYDVQPVDPLELWDSLPFEPEIRGGQVYARGAQDNKGQCFYVLRAIKALKQRFGSLPVNVKMLIEGDEETGSAGLASILEAHKDDLAADHLFVVDVGIREENAPSVTLGLRGVVAMDVECHGSSTDLHSGCHGGLAYNPIHALAEILAKLRDSDGRIAVPGFYDDVVEWTDEQKSLYDFNFDEEQYRKEFGAEATGGERSLPPCERNWLRPSLEICGISGGYAGTGFKTVIAAVASAKVSCRVVPNQDPQVTMGKVAQFLKDSAPPGIEVKTHIHEGCGRAVVTDPDSAGVRAVAEAFSIVFDKPCSFIMEGASIPIVEQLQKVSQANVVLMGLGLSSDRIHAPNEHFGLDRLERGYLVIGQALTLLGQTQH